MKKKIEQILNGKFKYDQPELLFSKEKLEIKIKAGTTTQGELYLGTENNDKIQGYITSSDRRFVPGNSRFSGTTVRLPYGIDAVGMQAGDICRGWLCVTSSIGEYKLPFAIEAIKEEIISSVGKVDDMQTFCEIARKDFREAYHLFTEKDFCMMFRKAESVVCRSVRTASNLSASGGISDQSEGKRSCFRILKNYRSRIL